jgi:L-alanine-DL-glutamate epimerase-like enolase superfamily enzyme
MAVALTVRCERWPIAEAFSISRGSKTSADVVLVELTDGDHSGRGESVPYTRYSETVPGVLALIESMRTPLEHGLDRHSLQRLLPRGAARSALDCAFWDLEAKRCGRPVYELAGLPPPHPIVTAYTISLGPPEAMAEAAAKAAWRPLLKVKLGAEQMAECLRAVRAAAPSAELIVDANESWTADKLTDNFTTCADAGVSLVEQPLPAGNDEALLALPRLVAVCADESLHDRASLQQVIGKYDAINIKIDKAGGLTEALALLRQAKSRGLTIMVGCTVATSLAIAPAVLVAQTARYVDLDGPLLLSHDRGGGLRYDGSVVHPPNPAWWG